MHDKLEQVMLTGRYEAATRDELRTRLEETGVFKAVRSRLDEHVKQSIKNLAFLPETEYRTALGDIAAFVTRREN
jgi:geranylgeranyl pyrophosphate synthase